MKLVKTSFDKLNVGGECLFRTDKHTVVHVMKVNHTVILNQMTKERAFTGQHHEVWEIDPHEPQRT